MMNQALTGGMVVSRALQRYGIRTVFALAGASHTHLLDALDRDGVRIISNRHESGCISAADGYARITGKLGVALIIADQGTPNAINGIAAAYHACSPVLILIARLPDSWIEAESEYDNLKHPLVGSISKWARSVPSAARLAEYVDVAAKRALSGRRGPVVLQIQQEFFAAVVNHAGAAVQAPSTIARTAADPVAIEQAAMMLQRAKRPLLIVGAGATQSGAGAALQALVQHHQLPIAGNGLGRGLVAEDLERSFNWPLMQIAAREADVVCVIGARLKQRLGYGLPPRFAAEAQFIQIDVEAEELSRNRRIDVPICADARLACEQLLQALQRLAPPSADRAAWLRWALQPRLEFLDRLVTDEQRKARPRGIHPLVLGRKLASLAPADTIWIGDGADIQTWMYGAVRVQQAPGFLDHYPLGAMGVGTPLAVGASAAASELAQGSGDTPRTVILTTGDGSFGFYPAELHAAARAGLKLICIVGNDGAWGTELHGQRAAIGRAVNTELGHLRYDRVGEGFGCRGEFVETEDELEPALQRALACEGPSVLNVIIDQEAGALLKSEPLAQLIMFDDLASNLQLQHQFSG